MRLLVSWGKETNMRFVALEADDTTCGLLCMQKVSSMEVLDIIKNSGSFFY